MVKHGSRRHRMKRGGGPGDSEVRPHGTNDITMEGLNEMTDSAGKMSLELDNQMGGRKTRKHHRHTKKCRHMKKSRKTRKYGGNGVISTALLPFGLFGLQKYFQRNRTAKSGVKGLGNKVKRGFKGIKKMF